MFRFGVGFDLPLSRYLVLSLEASYDAAGGSLDFLNYAHTGGSIIYRF